MQGPRTKHERLPYWLVKRIGPAEVIRDLKKDLRDLKLHTVCEEARCPNIGECWSRGTATLMVLGSLCSRHCGFCAVAAGKPSGVDPEEPDHVAQLVRSLSLRHVVITMVARDDLLDGGSGHLAKVTAAVRRLNPETKIELLTSDFQGRRESLQEVVDAGPDVFNHNIETVERLTPEVRHRATYRRSLEVLRGVKGMAPRLMTKSGLMLGLGETSTEILQTLQDLRAAGCELLTIGQYLRPSLKNLPVVEYIRPEIFSHWQQVAEEIGFRKIASGPLVRSSYHAEEMSAFGG